MSQGCPKLVAIEPDGYHAKHVGRLADGRQFFLTNPFVPGQREFLALYLFDPAGQLVEARIEDLGTREELDREAVHRLREAWLLSLGDRAPSRIEVAPFYVERFGVEFGLIPQPPEEPDEDWSVIVKPGNYMCFWPPWTSGDYDT
jgi:hypothetical protein